MRTPLFVISLALLAVLVVGRVPSVGAQNAPGAPQCDVSAQDVSTPTAKPVSRSGRVLAAAGGPQDAGADRGAASVAADLTASITADVNDWSPPTLATTFVLRVRATGAHRVSGIAVPESWRTLPAFQHRNLTVCLVAGGSLTFAQESARSQSAHRFASPTFTLGAHTCAALLYDAVSERWLRVGS